MANNTTTEYEVADTIRYVYPYVLNVIGLPANILAIIVVLTMQKMTSATFFVATLAVFDGCALVSKLIFGRLNFYMMMNDLLCKVDFISLFFTTMGTWTLAYICVERFISVCYPLKKSYLVTLHRCYASIAVTAVIYLSIMTPLQLVMVESSDGSCYVKEAYGEFWNTYFYWISSIITFICPYLCIVTLTIIIIVKLKAYAKDRRKMFTNSGPHGLAVNTCNVQAIQDNERSERVLTVMLTLTAIVFLVLAFPSCFVYLSKIEISEFWFQIFYLMFDSTHALNFFLYFLTARRFRERLCHLFSCDHNKQSTLSTDDVTPTEMTITQK